MRRSNKASAGFCPSEHEWVSHKEYYNAVKERVEFCFNLSPHRIYQRPDGQYCVEVEKTQMSVPNADGRQRVEIIPDSTHCVTVDVVILTLGFNMEAMPGLIDAGVECNKWGGSGGDCNCRWTAGGFCDYREVAGLSIQVLISTQISPNPDWIGAYSINQLGSGISDSKSSLSPLYFPSPGLTPVNCLSYIWFNSFLIWQIKA